ncbi:MAG TPA: hypothetical protein PK926_01120 [Spirochaetota bacterium]|nr:hypothetical protein [Spirochaetota bacterium]HPI91324.1 hypothetical protein [Spirochaetota bacterium]HPR47318.1 hypothetical protein [Spirochaetota bacterium]
MMKQAVFRARDRIRWMNRAQKKVLFGMIFFLAVNAVILVVSIILISKLVNKL